MEFQLAYALLLAINLIHGVHSAVFTIKNNCPFTIAPATQKNMNGAPASSTGFELRSGGFKDVSVPSPWSGGVWARFECSNNGGKFSCNSGDCGTGQVTCNGAGAAFATLAEFTIGGAFGKDYFDVSLVDGFNLPISIVPQARCPARSCPVHINARCPRELAAPNGAGRTIGCKSACFAFGNPEYCCTGAYADRCPPTGYSRFFKNLCPEAYTYAKDDKETASCNTGVNYVIKFCP